MTQNDGFGGATAARDLDGDGRTDLVVGDQENPVVIRGSPARARRATTT